MRDDAVIRLPWGSSRDLPCSKNIPGTVRKRVGHKDRTESSWRQFVLTCFLTISLLATVVPVSAATVTIDNTTAGGISQAINNAGSGGTVILNPGTYFIDTSKEILFPITIKANTSRGGDPSNTIIDGIRFTNKLFYVTTSGRAITIDNLTVQHFSNPGFHGGVIYSWMGPVTITSSKFVNCTAKYGGAIFTDKKGATGSSITSSTFSGCTATDSGGAIYVMSDTLTVIASAFTSGSAPTGSTIYSQNTGTTIHFSRFFNNSGTVVYLSSAGTLDATNNWWGSNANPSGSVGGVGTVNANPWLKLGTTADATLINSSQTTRIRANLTFNSDGTNISGSGRVPDGIPVAFGITSGTGSILPAAGNITSGTNTTVFTPAIGGTSQINATVDRESLSVLVTMLNATFTGTPTLGTIPLTIGFTDSTAGSPVMWNWSFGDGSWFNTTSVTVKNPTHTYTGTGTYTVNLTVTRADVTDMLSRTGYITASAAPVTTTPTPTPTPTPTSTPTPIPQPNGGSDDSPAFALKAPLKEMLTTISTNVGQIGRTSIIHVEITGVGNKDIIITATEVHGPGTDVPPPPGIIYEYVDISPARFSRITEANILFVVPQSWLDEHHLTPREIILYHNTGKTWQPLPTIPDKIMNGEAYYTARSDGFSRFAITGQFNSTPSTQNATASNTANMYSAPVQVSGTKSPVIATSPVNTAPVTTRTTAPPVPLPPAPVFPFATIVAAVSAGVMLIGSRYVIRRWWIQRQNPALFREYD